MGIISDRLGEPSEQPDYEVVDALRADCIDAMSAVFDVFEKRVGELGGDTELFSMQILEQWRPW